MQLNFLILASLFFATTFNSIEPVSVALEVGNELGRVEANNERVPQLLLALAHTPQVQRELGLVGGKLDTFESRLRLIDQRWWPARILAVEKQRVVVAELEKQLEAEITKLVGAEKLSRLHQLQVQAQSSRALARGDVQKLLGLSKAQLERLDGIFEKTDSLGRQIKPSAPDSAIQEKYQAATKSEAADCLKLLTPEQIQSLQRLGGTAFNTADLKRVFPLAPELYCETPGLNSDQAQLRALKGNVVLVHFYAFQCSNCHANFPHYKRWSSTLADKGVKVIGIQTPETEAEGDPEKILAAAEKQGLNFPVVFDLDKKNWDAWGNTMWPTVYVIDKRGYIRLWWQGELNYQGATGDKQIESLVEQLLKE